jgi:hypothetical protein
LDSDGFSAQAFTGIEPTASGKLPFDPGHPFLIFVLSAYVSNA